VTRAVVSGQLRAGDRFPSVRQLMRTHEVSLSTALQACRRLEDEGWLEARARSGYFVRQPRRAALPPSQEPRPDTIDAAAYVGIQSHISSILARGQYITDAFDESKAVDFSLKPGEMAMFTNALVHGSGTNLGPDRRFLLLVEMLPTWAKPPRVRQSALLVRGSDARRLGLKTIEDAAREAPHWRAGFGYEFLERPDGYPGLAKTYGLQFASAPHVMDLTLSYRALASGQVDLIAGDTTAGLIKGLDLVRLEDNRRYFPPYDAVPVARAQTLLRYPQVRAALERLAGRISADDMQAMNYAADGLHEDVGTIVRRFLDERNRGAR